MSRIYLMHYDKAKVRSVEEAVAKLSKLADVEYAEPNRIVYALGGINTKMEQSIAYNGVANATGGG